MRDLYEVLGVARGTPAPDDIKKAYRKLAQKLHPDENPGDEKAEEQFKEVSAAYSTLSDVEKRKAYDQFGAAGGVGAAGIRPARLPRSRAGRGLRHLRPARRPLRARPRRRTAAAAAARAPSAGPTWRRRSTCRSTTR